MPNQAIGSLWQFRSFETSKSVKWAADIKLIVSFNEPDHLPLLRIHLWALLTHASDRTPPLFVV